MFGRNTPVNPPAKNRIDMSNTADSRIEAFLDDRMDSSEKQAFLDLLHQDPELRAEFDRQRAIDASLRRICDESRLDPLLGRLETALHNAPETRLAARSPVRVWRGFAAAALLAFSVCGVWYSWNVSKPKPIANVYEPQRWRSFETVYYDTIRNGFKPAWICRDERQFQRAFSDRFRQPLLLSALPSGITAGGIAYSNTITESTINVLGKVDGTPIMIFVDKVAADHGPPPPPPPQLHLFRREIDNLVLYELTPLDRPHILPFFYNPK